MYDVSTSPMYQEGGNYSMFAGKDASVSLAKMNFAEELMDPKKNHWTKSLSAEENGVLEGWAQFFEGKYEVVGYMEGEEPEGEKMGKKDE